jgi:ATP-dependent DNA helicase RecG
MQKAFSIGDMVVLSGVVKPDQYNNRAVIENPEYEVMSGEGDDTVHTGRIVPIYRTTAGLSVRSLRQIMKGIVDEYSGGLVEFLPEALLSKYRIPVLSASVADAHFPELEKDLAVLNTRSSRAYKRLIFDEFLLLQMGLALIKRGRSSWSQGIAMMGNGTLTGKFVSGLPFKLTAAQRRVISEIYSDMASDRQMNRLVQGDVGSGKTAVALAAILRAAESGYQSALMAPTEILAEQHFLNVKRPLEELGLGVTLLTSSLGKRQKQRALEDIAEGHAALAVGTHSLLQEGVEFKNLGLAVTDEQHRFGVMQRALLMDKGISPDVLVMTATPIPRTLALTVYGDLDVSIIDSMPPGRSTVVTKLFDEGSRAEVYRLIKRELTAGRQAYVVYPLVEESERSDLRAATEGAKKLSEDVFPDIEVGLLHGRMKPADKDAVMSGFRSGAVRLLVATTVVEVGVDVPNATVMVIEHAERFGLAQLHQLRGRVGRGAHQSYCVLVASGWSDSSRERLGAMMRHTSGFDIAEEDLRIRGPGEFLGTRQSGLPELTVGNIIRDAKILEAARREASGIIEVDPGLERPEHSALSRRLDEKWRDRLGMIRVG